MRNLVKVNKKINSKIKGKTGELEFSKVCHKHGFSNVRRAQQYCGGSTDSADCIGLQGVHIEVKRVEKLNIDKAMQQATDDMLATDDLRYPIVAHRKNRKEWLITMYADDWFVFYNRFIEDAHKNIKNEEQYEDNL